MDPRRLVVVVLALLSSSHQLMVDGKPSSSDSVASDAGGSRSLKATTCGQSNSQSNGGRLMGGQPALPNEFPWHVFIEAQFIQEFRYPDCPVTYTFIWETSGVLLSDQWILTSARGMQWGATVYPITCNNVTYGQTVDYPPANDITLVFAAHNVSEGQNNETEPQREMIKTWQLFFHPQWDARKTKERIPYDLALIRLPEPITFNDYIRPICLPDASDSGDHIGDMVKLTGWGEHQSIVSTSSAGVQSRQYVLKDVLLQTDVPVLSNDQCKPNFADFNLDDQMVACVGGPTYAANGDDGGPMAYSQDGVNGWTLFGILSQANSKSVNLLPAEERNSSIGVRVHPHLEWIHSLMNDENLVIPPSPAPITPASTEKPPSTTPASTVSTTTSSTSPATVPDSGAVLCNPSIIFLLTSAILALLSDYPL